MRLRLLIAAAGVLAAVGLAAGGIAMAQSSGGSDDRDERVSGAAAERAGAAAVEAVGTGRITAVERESAEAYEVEVTKPDGSTVDVELDQSLRVVEVDADERSDGADDGSREDDPRDDGDERDGPNDDERDGPNEPDDDSGEDRDDD